jgi:hypothetical protein
MIPFVRLGKFCISTKTRTAKHAWGCIKGMGVSFTVSSFPLGQAAIQSHSIIGRLYNVGLKTWSVVCGVGVIGILESR